MDSQRFLLQSRVQGRITVVAFQAVTSYQLAAASQLVQMTE
jgi:hypothetical protein